MSIKDSAEIAFFSSHPKEKEIALKLDECFDVTFAFEKSGVSIWVLDPKRSSKDRFGFIKEILLLYTSFTKLDARIFTNLDEVCNSTEFKNRVDKSFAILIHSSTLEDADNLEKLLKTQDDKIIVPIYTNEILNPHRGEMYLRSKISKVLGSVDLFGMSSPIKMEKYFFGRNELLLEITTKTLVHKENCGLFGLRKTGKTSVLFSVERTLAKEKAIVQYIDCQNPGFHSGRWWQALEDIIDKLIKASFLQLKKTIQKTHRYNETSAAHNFHEDILKIISVTGAKSLMLCFDEIEYITPSLCGQLGKHWDSDFLPFWQTIRAVHQETKGHLVFILAGVNPKIINTTNFGAFQNPIFQLAQAIYLPQLSKEEVREMVRTIGRYSGINFDESTYEYLIEQFGGHPFLIRLSCSEIWKGTDSTSPIARPTVSRKEFEINIEKIMNRLDSPVKDIFLSLVWWYPEEYDLLQLLANGDEDYFNEYITNFPEHIAHFYQYGLISSKSKNFTIQVMKKFLLKNGKEYLKEISPFKRGDFPPELLPETPDMDLLGKLFFKRSEIEVMLRKIIILYLGMKYNFDPKKVSESMSKCLNPTKERPNGGIELFIGRKPQDVVHELFTIDLKLIILENWETFKNIFNNEKSRFEMNMDCLNKARRFDAHTKPITKDDVIEIDNSYSWLLSRLPKLENLGS